jgi:hypothetical protein
MKGFSDRPVTGKYFFDWPLAAPGVEAFLLPTSQLVGTDPPGPNLDYFRVADNPGAISFCINLEFHAKIAEWWTLHARR